MIRSRKGLGQRFCRQSVSQSVSANAKRMQQACIGSQRQRADDDKRLPSYASTVDVEGIFPLSPLPPRLRRERRLEMTAEAQQIFVHSMYAFPISGRKRNIPEFWEEKRRSRVEFGDAMFDGVSVRREER